MRRRPIAVVGRCRRRAGVRLRFHRQAAKRPGARRHRHRKATPVIPLRKREPGPRSDRHSPPSTTGGHPPVRRHSSQDGNRLPMSRGRRPAGSVGRHPLSSVRWRLRRRCRGSRRECRGRGPRSRLGSRRRPVRNNSVPRGRHRRSGRSNVLCVHQKGSPSLRGKVRKAPRNAWSPVLGRARLQVVRPVRHPVLRCGLPRVLPHRVGRAPLQAVRPARPQAPRGHPEARHNRPLVCPHPVVRSHKHLAARSPQGRWGGHCRRPPPREPCMGFP